MMTQEPTPFDSVDQSIDDDSSSLVLCTIDLFDEKRDPIVGERVTVSPRYIPSYPANLQVFAHQTTELVTDENGHALIVMLQGTEADVVRASTGEKRVVRVPVDETHFELWTTFDHG